MKGSYVSYVIEFALYYILIIFGLPMVYAVTYHHSLTDVFTREWLMLSLYLSPLILLLAGLRLFIACWKQTDEL
ncbi:hypothetical protein ACSFB8_08620 [Enterococcus faecalis]